jgi:hypothetical protein
MAISKQTMSPLGSTERTNELLGGNYFDTKTGKANRPFTPTVTPIFNSNNSINSNNLKSTTPFVLPNKPIATETSGMQGAINTSITNAKAEREAQNNLALEQARNAQKRNLRDIVDIQELLGQTGQRTEQAYQEQGVDKLRESYDEFTNQLEQESQALTRKLEDLDKNPQGLFGGALQQEKERVSRESLRKQADIAILQNSALRKYDTARSIADRKIQLELEPLKARLETMKFIYGENKELFTTQERRQYEASIRDEERQYKETEDNKIKGNEYIVNALQGQAPRNLIQKAQEIYNRGGSAQEIATILGEYSLSLSDKLSIALQRKKLNEVNGGGSGSVLSGLPVSIQGKIISQSDKFNTSDIVKKYNATLDAINIVNGISPTSKNTADHQAIVYAFAKSLDPDSVVREGEYETIKKYAQSAVDRYGKEIQNALTGKGFLSENAIKNIQQTMNNNYKSRKPQYDNLKKETGRVINNVAGKDVANDILVDFTSGFTESVDSFLDNSLPEIESTEYDYQSSGYNLKGSNFNSLGVQTK